MVDFGQVRILSACHCNGWVWLLGGCALYCHVGAATGGLLGYMFGSRK